MIVVCNGHLYGFSLKINLDVAGIPLSKGVSTEGWRNSAHSDSVGDIMLFYFPFVWVNQTFGGCIELSWLCRPLKAGADGANAVDSRFNATIQKLHTLLSAQSKRRDNINSNFDNNSENWFLDLKI